MGKCVSAGAPADVSAIIMGRYFSRVTPSTLPEPQTSRQWFDFSICNVDAIYVHEKCVRSLNGLLADTESEFEIRYGFRGRTWLLSNLGVWFSSRTIYFALDWSAKIELIEFKCRNPIETNDFSPILWRHFAFNSVLNTVGNNFRWKWTSTTNESPNLKSFQK